MKLLWELLDFIIIISFMLLGMAIVHLYEYMIWYGAFGGLLAHFILRRVIRTIRDHVRL